MSSVACSLSSPVLPGVDRLRVHLGLQPGGAAPGRARLALHPRLQDAPQVGPATGPGLVGEK